MFWHVATRNRRTTRATTAVAILLLALLVAVPAGGAPSAPAPPAPPAPAPRQVPVPAADGTPPLTPETFADPPASVRPGTRWWWDDLVGTLGGPSYDFNLDDALEEVDAFAAAGFGRFEIAWRGGDYGTESQQAQPAGRGRAGGRRTGCSWT